jgi:hypothetical protein
MNTVIRASVILAVVVAVIIATIAGLGLHQIPVFNTIGVILLFTLINIVIVFWALAKTAPENGYLKQLGNSALIGLIGGLLIFVLSYLLMSFVFPQYLSEYAAAILEQMEFAGAPAEQIDLYEERLSQMTTVGQAFQGFIGTFFTSLIAGAIIAYFKRKKEETAAA